MYKSCNSDIVFTEECDGYFKKELTKEQAIEMLEEAIMCIKKDLV